MVGVEGFEPTKSALQRRVHIPIVRHPCNLGRLVGFFCGVHHFNHCFNVRKTFGNCSLALLGHLLYPFEPCSEGFLGRREWIVFLYRLYSARQSLHRHPLSYPGFVPCTIGFIALTGAAARSAARRCSVKCIFACDCIDVISRFSILLSRGSSFLW